MPQDSEERARFALEASGLGLWDWDIARGKVYFSPQWKEMLGYGEAEIGEGFDEWEKRVHPDDLASTLALVKDCLEGQQRYYDSEHRMLCRDGSYKWIRDRGMVIERAHDGKPLRMTGTHSDISQGKQNEARMREEKAKLDAALASMSDAVFISDAEGRFIEFNDAFASFHRFASKAECATTLAEYPALIEVFGPDGRQLPLDEWAVPRALRGESAVNAQFLLRRKDTGERWTGSYNFAPIRDAQGIIVGAVVSGRDVTAQKAGEQQLAAYLQQLQDSEQRYRSMIEHSPIGIYVTQQDRIVYANTRLCKLLEMPAEQLIGSDSLYFIGHDPEVRRKVVEARTQLHSGRQSTPLVAPFRRHDGRELVLLFHGSMGQWGGQASIIAMVEDITERQRAEEKIASYIVRLKSAMRGSLQAVANMVEARDPYTAGHERRVGLIAADIVREMGWPEERCDDINLMGLVHDIGKIGVPAETLVSPRRLSKIEYELVKVHAERGYEILREIDFPMPIAEAIRQHHERMDGSGYPRGLKGEAILPEARVLAVADVVESMSSHRPYRAALGIDVALKELTDHSGTLYDPPVVEALVRMVRDKGYRLPE